MITTAVGTWGDVIAAYGNINKLLDSHSCSSCKVIYLGLDENVKNFLQIQDGISEVIWAKVPRNEYFHIAQLASKCQIDWKKWIDTDEQIIETHISEKHLYKHPEQCHRVSCNLPHPTKDWSKEIRAPKKTLLFQPFSTNSVSPIDHWPFWFNALEWLEKSDWTPVVIGQQYGGMMGRGFVFPDISHIKGIVDLVGKTKSMVDVFSISSMCDGVLTTSNCLSMWTIITNKPALVVCNKRNLTSDYYHNWINHKPNTVLKTNTCFETFKKEFASWERKLK